jgi:hypothetical protein
VTQSKVSFKYKDYRDQAKNKIASLSQVEFLRRFSLHVVPHRFVRIRHYGILASRNKAKDLNIARIYHKLQPWQKIEIDWETLASKIIGKDFNQCPTCKGPIEMLALISPQRVPPITQRYDHEAI